MSTRRFPLAVAGLLAILTGPALAATDTTTFNVTIDITASCNVDGAAPTDVAFGSQPSTATNVDANGNLAVLCTPSTAYTIALNSGQNGANVNGRAMANGTTLVPYQLYRAAARGASDVWGETTGTNTVAGTGNGAIQNISIYGRVPSANFPVQAYSDVVTATLTF